jgi:hypothetical protein
MNVDKAKKRIAKQVQKGFKGYPQITIAYFGSTADFANQVKVTFMLGAEKEPQEQKLSCERDARYDETIQSVLVKIIERADANTVIEIEGVAIIS